MSIGTCSNNIGPKKFVSFEKTDVVQISNISFSYNRFSAANIKAMGRFIIQLVLSDDTWSTRSDIPENDR